jgi:hypothetical protein
VELLFRRPVRCDRSPFLDLTNRFIILFIGDETNKKKKKQYSKNTRGTESPKM